MDEVLINTTTTGNQGQPGVCGLQGTQFVVVWEDRSDNNIKGKMFGTDGVASSPEMLINFPTQPPSPVPRRQLPAIVEYGFGFVVAWTEQAAGSPATAETQLKIRIFDVDTLSGPEIQVSTSPIEPLIRPALARLSDGNFIVVWADKRADERIRAQRFAPDGTRIGTEFRANTTPGLHHFPMVVCLANGDVVIAWRARIAPLHSRFQIFNAQGPVGSEQVTPQIATEAAMAALTGGQFVIARMNGLGEDATANDLIVVEADIFNADGSPANIHFVSTNEQRIHASWPTLSPLSDGRFMISWVQRNVDQFPPTTNVKARVFSTQGPLGQVIQFNTSTGGNRFSLAAVAVSSPQEIAFAAWADDTESGGDPTGRAVRGRPLKVPTSGF